MSVEFHAVDPADGRDCWTRYHGQKLRVAVFHLAGERHALSLSDTRRCTADLEACRETLRNLAPADLPSDPGVHAGALNVYCRKLTRWVEKPKRDKPLPAAVGMRRRYL